MKKMFKLLNPDTTKLFESMHLGKCISELYLFASSATKKKMNSDNSITKTDSKWLY